MTDPAAVPVTPPVQAAPEAVVPPVAAGPSKTDRAKTLAKKTFVRVGVPVLIGSAAAWVATRRTTAHLEIESAPQDAITSTGE